MTLNEDSHTRGAHTTDALRLPPELTKANQPLMILVLREGLAVRERARRRFFLRNRVTEPRLQILAKRRGGRESRPRWTSTRNSFLLLRGERLLR